MENQKNLGVDVTERVIKPTPTSSNLCNWTAGMIGACIVRLSAAAALARHFGTIIILERDRLFPVGQALRGTPQFTQPHVLLGGGLGFTSVAHAVKKFASNLTRESSSLSRGTGKVLGTYGTAPQILAYKVTWSGLRGKVILTGPRRRSHARALSPLFTAIISVLVLCASGKSFAADIPAEIEVFGKKEILKLHAEGVQIYECKADGASVGKWTFREPLATLLHDGKTVGRHYAGPSWELAAGSTVVGTVVAQAPGKTANDIANLKLIVAQRRGDGQLANATTVQRLNTKGGVFSGTCDTLGSLHPEPYSAEYVFLAN